MSKRLVPAGRLYVDAYGVPDRSLHSLPVYAICVVWVEGTDADLEAAFLNVRSALGLRRDYEFHARLLTKHERSNQLPKRFFEQLLASHINFSVWCAEMIKRRSSLPLHIQGKGLTYELVSQACIRMPPHQVGGHTLTFDNEATGKKVSQIARELRVHVNTALEVAGRADQLARVIPKPADRCAGLQPSDFLAAAIVTPWSDCLDLLSSDQVHYWRT